jgi:hypothetical protein
MYQLSFSLTHITTNRKSPLGIYLNQCYGQVNVAMFIINVNHIGKTVVPFEHRACIERPTPTSHQTSGGSALFSTRQVVRLTIT